MALEETDAQVIVAPFEGGGSAATAVGVQK